MSNTELQLPPYIKIESIAVDRVLSVYGFYFNQATVIIANNDGKDHNVALTLHAKSEGVITRITDINFETIPALSKKRESYSLTDTQLHTSLPLGQWRIVNMIVDKKTYPFQEIILKTHNNEGCFVVTAAFGNPHHPVVESFRSMRDEVLATTKLGQKFISWYYKNGPHLATIIKDKPLACATARAFLTPASALYNRLRSKGSQQNAVK